MRLIQDLGTRLYSKKMTRFGIFECEECQNKFEKPTSWFKNKENSRCQSCANRKSSSTHSKSNTKLYNVWHGIKQRCFNKKTKAYKDYGERNITVCKDWLDFENFYNWAINSGYKEGLTIDRINNNGNYEPSNCRWENSFTQNTNRQKIQNNNSTGYRGVSFNKKKNKFIAQIRVENKNKYLHSSSCRLKCAYIYDNYIRDNNLNYVTNF